MEDFRRVSHFYFSYTKAELTFFRYSVGGKPHCFVQYLTGTVCTGASAVKGREMTLLDDLRLFETDAYVIHLPVPGRSWLTVFTFTFTSLASRTSKMLRGVARLSLRRGIHTSRPVSSAGGLSRHRFAMAAGASVIAASYLGWRISLENGRDIALDSDSTRIFLLLS